MKRLMILVLAIIIALLSFGAASAQTVKVTVIAASLRVRAGPGSEFDQIGLLQRGATVAPDGRDGTGYWLRFPYGEKTAWIGSAAELVKIEGDLDVLPKEDQKSGGTLSTGDAQIEVVDYTLSPSVPSPREKFVMRIRLASDEPVSSFALAGTVGEEFFFAPVQFLSSTSEHEVQVNIQAPATTGWQATEIVVDVDRSVSAGATIQTRIFIDYYRELSGRLRVVPYSNLNVDDGNPDLAWDGVSLTALGDALVMILDMRISDAHFEAIQPEETEIAAALLTPGTLMGLYTNEGRRALVWIKEVQNADLVVEVFLYK